MMDEQIPTVTIQFLSPLQKTLCEDVPTLQKLVKDNHAMAELHYHRLLKCRQQKRARLVLIAMWQARAEHGFDPEEPEESVDYWRGVRAVCEALK